MWKKRKEEIDNELGKVWVQEDGEEKELEPPSYLESQADAGEQPVSEDADDDERERQAEGEGLLS